MSGSTAVIKLGEGEKAIILKYESIQNNVYKISVAIHISFACSGWWIKYNEI
jgi:hypothetical protein